MKILITGGSGFIGHSFYDALKHNNTVLIPTHNELDLLDFPVLEKYIVSNHIECVIHAAIMIGRKFAMTTPEMAYYNLVMFENLISASKSCKYFIGFGGGSEYANYPNEIITMCKEEDIFTHYVSECGGFYKRLISKRMLSINQPKCINLRFAGGFGKYESNDRFIKSNLLKVIKKQPIIIHQNRKMDFIFIDDLINIAKFSLTDSSNIKDINCCYTEKYTLLDISQMILNITNIGVPIIIEKKGMESEYTLDNTKLQNLQIPLIGLKKGIEITYGEISSCL